MRNKRLWKNLMLATVCTAALGTTSVPVLAADVNTEAGTAIEVEAEVETAEIEKEEAVEEAVPTPAPQTEVEAEELAPEADNSDVTVKAAEPKLSITANTPVYDGTQDIVLTLKAEYDGDCHIYGDTVCTINGKTVGTSWDFIGDGYSEAQITLYNNTIMERFDFQEGDELVITTDQWSVEYTDENGETKSVYFPTFSMTYSTENPDGGNGDNGNTEAPDSGNTETPETPNGNTETPNGNTDNGNTETPNGDNANNDTQTPDAQTPNSDPVVQPVTTTKTSPKTGDMAAVLPVLGTGLSSLGVAFASILRKRKLFHNSSHTKPLLYESMVRAFCMKKQQNLSRTCPSVIS